MSIVNIFINLRKFTDARGHSEICFPEKSKKSAIQSRRQVFTFDANKLSSVISTNMRNFPLWSAAVSASGRGGKHKCNYLTLTLILTALSQTLFMPAR